MVTFPGVRASAGPSPGAAGWPVEPAMDSLGPAPPGYRSIESQYGFYVVWLNLERLMRKGRWRAGAADPAGQAVRGPVPAPRARIRLTRKDPT